MQVVPTEVLYATNAMMVGEPYQGVIYSSLQLSGRTVAKPADKYGEGTLVPQLVTTYWPGGADGVTPNSVITMDFMSDGNESTTPLFDTTQRLTRAIHKQISGMDLANTTLAASRYQSDLMARNMVDHDALSISYDQYVPLGGIAISHVVAHNQLPAGSYAARLYFPVRTVYPVFILNAIKTALPTK